MNLDNLMNGKKGRVLFDLLMETYSLLIGSCLDGSADADDLAAYLDRMREHVVEGKTTAKDREYNTPDEIESAQREGLAFVDGLKSAILRADKFGKRMRAQVKRAAENN